MRGIWRLRALGLRLVEWWREITFSPYVKKKKVEGLEFDFYIGNTEGRDWYDIHSTDPFWPEMRFIRDKMIETGDIILECGGHHGCTAILLSKWVGENGRVVTFEPDPRSVAILNKNVTLNRLANVVVEAKAVGAQENRIRFTIRSGVLSTSAREVGAIEIGMTTLDNYLDLNPTFAKIDVEGYEYEVVKGASRLLERRPKLEIEIHPAALVEHGSSPAQVLALIPLREYDCFIQWNDETEPVPFSGDEPIEKRAHFFAIPKERRT